MNEYVDLTPLQDLGRKSLDDLIAEHGALRTTQELLNAVTEQHDAALKTVLAQIPKEYPTIIAPHVVHHDDTQYRIHGIAHSLTTNETLDEDYKKRVLKALGKGRVEKTVFEQHLTALFLSAGEGKSDIEMLDHALNTSSHPAYTLGGFCLPIILPLMLASAVSKKATRFMRVKTNEMRVEEEKEFLERYQKHHHLPAELRFTAEHLFNRPILQLKNRENIELDSVEQRSAYMAEFVKALKPTSVDLVVGGAHVNQIRYFLTHPIHESVNDQTPERIREIAHRVTDLAHTHAQQAIQSPHAYQETKAQWRKQYKKQAFKQFGVGALPWIGLGLYGTYRLLE